MMARNKTKELTKSCQKYRSILVKIQLKIPYGGLNIAFGVRGMATMSWCWGAKNDIEKEQKRRKFRVISGA